MKTINMAKIITKPTSLNYECPNCHEDICEDIEKFSDVWGDLWYGCATTTCPNCGEELAILSVEEC